MDELRRSACARQGCRYLVPNMATLAHSADDYSPAHTSKNVDRLCELVIDSRFKFGNCSHLDVDGSQC